MVKDFGMDFPSLIEEATELAKVSGKSLGERRLMALFGRCSTKLQARKDVQALLKQLRELDIQEASFNKMIGHKATAVLQLK